MLEKLKKYHTTDEKGKLFNIFNFLYYAYRRNNWMLDPRRYWSNFERVEIDRPVFILGFHGGGTTLLSRMIRRNQNFVSVSGNHKYWSGADEMQVVLGPILPPELTGIRHNLLAGLKPPTGWIYASDEYLDYYRKTEEDVTPSLRRRFRKIIRWMIARHAVNEKARFTDKSQVFTVKVSFINEILKDSDPKFILLVRDPYASCRGAVRGGNKNMSRNGISNLKEQYKVASQHYRNSVESALEDKGKAELKVVKFEHLLSKPKETLQGICGFTEIEFDEEMLPQPDHEICFGSTGRNKWFPLRPDVNEKHFDKLTKEKVDIIQNELKGLDRELGYSKPNVA